MVRKERFREFILFSNALQHLNVFFEEYAAVWTLLLLYIYFILSPPNGLEIKCLLNSIDKNMDVKSKKVIRYCNELVNKSGDLCCICV